MLTTLETLVADPAAIPLLTLEQLSSLKYFCDSYANSDTTKIFDGLLLSFREKIEPHDVIRVLDLLYSKVKDVESDEVLFTILHHLERAIYISDGDWSILEKHTNKTLHIINHE